jgi:hypothetical protein
VIFVWSTTRDRAIECFRGDTPGAQLEDTIVAHFEREPQRVIDAVEQIGRSIQRGGPNAPVSGWAVLAKSLTTVTPQERVVSDHAEMARQLAIAETWIRNAGGNIDREAELIAELYDEDLGRLRHWPDTQADIVAIWREQRPRFERTEREAEERQARQAEALRNLRSRRHDHTRARPAQGDLEEAPRAAEGASDDLPHPPAARPLEGGDDGLALEIPLDYLDSLAPEGEAA